MGSALKEIRALYSEGTQTGLTDGELLERFVTNRGEASEFAFSAIVRRHGPMVLRVCQQRLSDVHQSQDAFQSTFLILVKKAGSLRDRGSVGPWLFGVANRVAARSRTATARRTRHERRYVKRLATRGSIEQKDQGDVGVILHEEVRRLPARLRIPVVLCYFEGLTREQAAARLGWPIGTVASRLARARDRLRSRLTRRGVVLSATALSSSLGDVSAASSMLVHSTVEAAIRFAEGRATTVWAFRTYASQSVKNGLGSIPPNKLKVAGAVLTAVGALATIAGAFAYRPFGPHELGMPAQPGRGHERPERDARSTTAEMRVPDGPSQQDKIVREKQIRDALHNASKEQLMEAALRLRIGDSLLRALSVIDDPSRHDKAIIGKRIREALDRALEWPLVETALRSGIGPALLGALSPAAGPSRHDKVVIERRIREAFHSIAPPRDVR
jgi:RNA polymerase sigma factor (sigma-70 family)